MAERHDTRSLEAGPEQLLYAATLQKGMYIGLAILFVTFVIYLFGILDPHIPVQEIERHWSKDVHHYLEDAKIQPGWHWVTQLNKGDFLNFIGIAILAGVTIICFLVIIPLLLRQNDKVYALFSLVEAAILLFAASGLLTVGH